MHLLSVACDDYSATGVGAIEETHQQLKAMALYKNGVGGKERKNDTNASLLQPKQNKVWDYVLDIYGETQMKEGDKIFIPFRFLGQNLDQETGLAYHRFPYDSPATGTHISQYPIHLEAGQTNMYEHMGGPWGLTFIDRFPSWMSTKQRYERHHIIPYAYIAIMRFSAAVRNENQQFNRY